MINPLRGKKEEGSLCLSGCSVGGRQGRRRRHLGGWMEAAVGGGAVSFTLVLPSPSFSSFSVSIGNVFLPFFCLPLLLPHSFGCLQQRPPRLSPSSFDSSTSSFSPLALLLPPSCPTLYIYPLLGVLGLCTTALRRGPVAGPPVVWCRRGGERRGAIIPISVFLIPSLLRPKAFAGSLFFFPPTELSVRFMLPFSKGEGRG